jgi:uncharacterized membrane protein
MINTIIILFFLVFAFGYYTYVSNGVLISTIVDRIQQILSGTSTNFFNLSTRGSTIQLSIGLTAIISPWRTMNVMLQDITEIFIVVGVLGLVMSRDQKKINNEYFVWIIMSLAMVGTGIVLPFFATSLGMTRIYEVALIFLSLWGVSGGLLTLQSTLKIFRVNVKYASFFLLLILVIYFTFSTGFIYEVTGDVPISDSLGLQRFKISTGQTAVLFDNFYPWATEIVGATWLAQYRSSSISGLTSWVFADGAGKGQILLSYGLIPPGDSYYLSNNTKIPPFCYVYFGHLNVVNGLFTSVDIQSGTTQTLNTSVLSPALQNCNLIYSNGGSEILYSVP